MHVPRRCPIAPQWAGANPGAGTGEEVFSIAPTDLLKASRGSLPSIELRKYIWPFLTQNADRTLNGSTFPLMFNSSIEIVRPYTGSNFHRPDVASLSGFGQPCDSPDECRSGICGTGCSCDEDATNLTLPCSCQVVCNFPARCCGGCFVNTTINEVACPAGVDMTTFDGPAPWAPRTLDDATAHLCYVFAELLNMHYDGVIPPKCKERWGPRGYPPQDWNPPPAPPRGPTVPPGQLLPKVNYQFVPPSGDTNDIWWTSMQRYVKSWHALPSIPPLATWHALLTPLPLVTRGSYVKSWRRSPSPPPSFPHWPSQPSPPPFPPPQ